MRMMHRMYLVRSTLEGHGVLHVIKFSVGLNVGAFLCVTWS